MVGNSTHPCSFEVFPDWDSTHSISPILEGRSALRIHQSQLVLQTPPKWKHPQKSQISLEQCETRSHSSHSSHALHQALSWDETVCPVCPSVCSLSAWTRRQSVDNVVAKRSRWSAKRTETMEATQTDLSDLLDSCAGSHRMPALFCLVAAVSAKDLTSWIWMS